MRDAETESQHPTPRPKLKRCRLDGWELEETVDQPDLKRQLIKPFEFAHIKTISTPPPADLPKVESALEVAPPEFTKSNSSSESIRRGPSTVAELLEQERAVRAQSRRHSTSSTSSVRTPTRSGRPDRAITEKRRLWISKMPDWTKKRNVVRTQLLRSYISMFIVTRQGLVAHLVLYTALANHVSTPQADFFAGFYVGTITQPERFMGYSSCYADFNTHQQAQRALDAMDGMPLLGCEVEIEFAQEPTSPSVSTLVEMNKSMSSRHKP